MATWKIPKTAINKCCDCSHHLPDAPKGKPKCSKNKRPRKGYSSCDMWTLKKVVDENGKRVIRHICGNCSHNVYCGGTSPYKCEISGERGKYDRKCFCADFVSKNKR